MLNKERLWDLKSQIDEAKETISRLKGKKQGLTEELKERWKLDPEGIEEKLESLNKSIEQIGEKIEKGVQALEENFKMLKDDTTT